MNNGEKPKTKFAQWLASLSFFLIGRKTFADLLIYASSGARAACLRKLFGVSIVAIAQPQTKSRWDGCRNLAFCWWSFNNEDRHQKESFEPGAPAGKLARLRAKRRIWRGWMKIQLDFSFSSSASSLCWRRGRQAVCAPRATIISVFFK